MNEIFGRRPTTTTLNIIETYRMPLEYEIFHSFHGHWSARNSLRQRQLEASRALIYLSAQSRVRRKISEAGIFGCVVCLPQSVREHWSRRLFHLNRDSTLYNKKPSYRSFGQTCPITALWIFLNTQQLRECKLSGNFGMQVLRQLKKLKEFLCTTTQRIKREIRDVLHFFYMDFSLLHAELPAARHTYGLDSTGVSRSVVRAAIHVYVLCTGKKSVTTFSSRYECRQLTNTSRTSG